jgi:galactose mutarotase-like enzyme
MPFQIGAHPAFYYPEFNAAVAERGFFKLERTPRNEAPLVYTSPVEKGCVSPERHPLALDADGLLPIHTHTFDCDTYIFEDKQLRKVTLLSPSRRPYVSLEFDTPLVALWSPAKAHPDCPFVCIEPWYGRCDQVGYSGEWADRQWMQKLAPGEVFDVSYRITIE